MEATGDYAGAAVLRFFVVYRAMVRAKVEALRVAQMPDGAGRAWLATECREYVALARAWAEPPHPAMVRDARALGFRQDHGVRCDHRAARRVARAHRRRAQAAARARGDGIERQRHAAPACMPTTRPGSRTVACWTSRTRPSPAASRSSPTVRSCTVGSVTCSAPRPRRSACRSRSCRCRDTRRRSNGASRRGRARPRMPRRPTPRCSPTSS